MTREANEIDQAVSRTLRDSLEKIQRTAEELNQAVSDLVSACASTRPMNSLPPMLRAQTSAASIGAALEVLSRFVTSSLRPPAPAAAPEQSWVSTPPVPEFRPIAPATPAAPERNWVSTPPVVEPPTPAFSAAPVAEIREAEVQEKPFEPISHVDSQASSQEKFDANPEPIPQAAVETAPEMPAVLPEMRWPTILPPPVETVASFGASEIVEASAPVIENTVENREESADQFSGSASDSASGPGVPQFSDYAEMPIADSVPASAPVQDFSDAGVGFDLASLTLEQQELHRRANRVAKVSMQDIKLLRPNDVRLGQENRDLCFRLRDDLERAHKEYERRFQTIQGHPVDYFYDWMVEILANGDPQMLGEYPYPSTVFRH